MCGGCKKGNAAPSKDSVCSSTGDPGAGLEGHLEEDGSPPFVRWHGRCTLWSLGTVLQAHVTLKPRVGQAADSQQNGG